MSCKIYSVIRCVGDNAYDCIRKQIYADVFGMYDTMKIGGNDKDQIIWFSTSHNDFKEHITERFLLDKLEELGKGKVYDNPKTTTKIFRPISGTIKC